ncbi:uncharacterized protein PFL1_01937 [Pseudozyma flocculosa PF-1]|uniref:Related to TSR4 - cytoplasmic protein required for correct processing of the 20S pre-rRNA n=1 Tax=Pseudozyma flocculosa TaxID=84751 RepID=A0A5C3F0N9_9BASI|nr:uncharacterized protein PFL1_01937 [Pseudozyma flocculosa PF-1]EPQ30411.1 hypothetical protein PFL1_01937 [Pseudozyma flocculosa PF-1]SPO37486.1 related to TSR4 - cytoplasmic protein required for correct processing of the 20S pre-rRNA [Pseudozyma flocculosa]
MPRPVDDDDYDSDSGSEFSVTDVQLGLADGPLEGDDEANPLVSRIGGRAAWLPMTSTPPREVAQCNHCQRPMQLIVQIFAPLEGSAYDRCLMVWGCGRAECQRTDASSLKVIRVLKHNPRWAAKLEKQKQRREAREARARERAEQEAARKAEQERLSKINPFASNASTQAGGAGGLGDMLFGGGSAGAGAANANPFAAAAPEPAPTSTPTAAYGKGDDDQGGDGSSSEDDDDEDEEEERLAEELQIKADLERKTSKDSAWVKQVPKYPALYLNTVPEPSSSSKAADKKLTSSQAKTLKRDENYDEEELKAWGKEGYEKMMLDGIDDVFERFAKRVGAEGRQAVRYEFGGQPLPFHGRGQLYTKLWPKQSDSSAKPGQPIAVTRGAFAAGAGAATAEGGVYDASCIPPCPTCGSARTFEAQLMPNLINLLRPQAIQRGEEQTSSDDDEDGDDDDAELSHLSGEERRRAEIERELGRAIPAPPKANDEAKGAATEGAEAKKPRMPRRTGLTWSTAMIYVCEKDCCIPVDGSAEEGETWREEWVGVQFEDEA